MANRNQQQPQAQGAADPSQHFLDPAMQYLLGAHLADQMLQQQQQPQQPPVDVRGIMMAMLSPTTVGPNGTVTYRSHTSGVSPTSPTPIFPNAPDQQKSPPDVGLSLDPTQKKKKALPSRKIYQPGAGDSGQPDYIGEPPAYGGYHPDPFPFDTPLPGPGAPPGTVDSTITYGDEVPGGGGEDPTDYGSDDSSYYDS